MTWQPSTTLDALQARAALNRDIRQFFAQRHVLEVETPALSAAATCDANIESFALNTSASTITHDNKTQDTKRWLHTSPEYPMKRLLAAGSGDIYQICKVWRSDEVGRKHNPEFSLLEWYRLGFNTDDLMAETEQLLSRLIHAGKEIPLKPAKKYSYSEIFLEILGINPHLSTADDLAAVARKQALDIAGELDKDDWLDLLMTHCIEPQLPINRLCFIYDYPASQAALAECVMQDNIKLARRFEVYWGGYELGNGYQENTDAESNRQQFQHEAAKRCQRQQEAVPQDKRFLAALESGLPDCSGIAIGLDRVLMCRLGCEDIRQVLAFPWHLA